MNASRTPNGVYFNDTAPPQWKESNQSLERLKYLEELIEDCTKEELSYAIKLLALVLATSEEGKMQLGLPGDSLSEADIIFGLVLNASIALENAKKGEDPVRHLLQSIQEQEIKATVSETK